jgi:hypothetical protein
MFPGVRPIIRLAWIPTATILPVSVLSATTDGSFSAISRPRTYTSVFAVPRVDRHVTAEERQHVPHDNRAF